ncbi:hypothetical protein HLI_14435 [Halobacillus litoralis]|uniref:Uncharacterized protein n=1 Tax=Halobacillus litoralis TaxID=45668 RepID=A0A410MEY3_9BACI|nr:hypothetical protein HLI_14435 [Halobacillus litoralis]
MPTESDPFSQPPFPYTKVSKLNFPDTELLLEENGWGSLLWVAVVSLFQYNLKDVNFEKE